MDSVTWPAQPRRSFPTAFGIAAYEARCERWQAADCSVRRIRGGRDGQHAMTDTDPGTPGQAHRYREIASSVRALIPQMQQPEVRQQLRLLALEYERLAQGIEAMSEWLRIQTDRWSGPDS